jgi:hypothetical protein
MMGKDRRGKQRQGKRVDKGKKVVGKENNRF